MKMVRGLAIAIGLAAVFCMGVALVIQLVPFGRDHTNPPVIKEPQWDSSQTYDLAKRACFDCHSNETVWPWYSNIAPASWLVQRDVNKGREELNFSNWGGELDDLDELPEAVQEGEMPPKEYLLLHPEAQLTAQEKQILIQGFESTFGISGRAGHD